MSLPIPLTRRNIAKKAHWYASSCAAGRMWCPEFQRELEWKPRDVLKLVNSMVHNMIVGGVCLYRPTDDNGSNMVGENGKPVTMIVDGQQRLTAICLMLGIRPGWIDVTTWRQLMSTHSVIYDINKDEFTVATPKTYATLKKCGGARNAKVLLYAVAGPGDKLAELVTLSGAVDETHAVKMLADVRQRVRNYVVYGQQIDCDVKTACEQFQRLNTAGRRVAMEDIILSSIAASNPTFVRDNVRPFREELLANGHDVDTGLLVRSLMALTHETTRLNEVNRSSCWTDTAAIEDAWGNVTRGWRELLAAGERLGVTRFADWGAGNLALPLVLAAVRFPGCLENSEAFAWMIQALREQRYRSQQTERLADDFAAVHGATSAGDAIDRLWGTLSTDRITAFSADELRNTSAGTATARLPKRIMALAARDRGARDWMPPHAALFDNAAAAREAHHIVPMGWVASNVVDGPDVDVLANICSVTGETNNIFGDHHPAVYFANAGVDPDAITALLDEQAIGHSVLHVSGATVEAFLDERAALLAEELNAYLAKLGGARRGPLSESTETGRIVAAHTAAHVIAPASRTQLGLVSARRSA